MNTETLNYADEVLSFLEGLMMRGVNQFSVAWHKPSQQWAVSYPPDAEDIEEELEDAEEAGE